MPSLRSALLTLALRDALSQSVKSCGGPNDHLKNPVINLSPDPPTKGGTLTITASGTLDEDMAAANSNVDLSIQALKVVKVGVTGGFPMSISPGAPKGPFSLTVGPFSLPSNIPGSAVVKGQIHVVNDKQEPIMCIDLDLTVPAAETEDAGALQVEAPETISSCGKGTDHIPDFKLAASGGVTTMTGTLDEAVTKMSVDLDVSLKVLFISLPLKLNIPIEFTPGLVKGPIKGVVGPSTVAVSPNIKATIKGTMKVNDGNSEEVTCLNLDTIVGGRDAIAAPLKQCKAASYAFCCEVGKPCDCTKGTTAPGQCEQASYGFCCSVGTPCDCSKPPLEDNSTETVVV